MTEAEDTPTRTEEESSDTESGSGSGSESESGSGSESEEEKIEWLATTREKRSTAGNRLASLIQQEEPDDELELLFQEAEDDAGFEDAEEDQSDVQMDSSDDDEDQGPTAGADDLEGEKELQKQAKADKAKKRKMNDGMAKMFKKKVRIDPTARQAPPPRPRKKSERASWIPTVEDMPTRASSRKTTRQQKQELHAQMVEREFKRLKQLANMEKAAAAKQAAKKPAMTQDDHLAEAARVEKMNSKSLSRWEEAEAQREADQQAKLAALKDRKMVGPYITWWSGLGEWVGGKLKQVGKNLKIEEKEKHPPRKRKAAEMEADSKEAMGVSKVEVPSSTGTDKKEDPPSLPAPVSAPEAAPKSDPIPDPNAPFPAPRPEVPFLGASQMQPGNFPYASASTEREIPSGSSVPQPTNSLYPPPIIRPPLEPPRPPNSSVLAPPAGLPLTAPPLPTHFMNGTSSLYPSFTLAPPALDGSSPLPGFGYHVPQHPRFVPSIAHPFSFPPAPAQIHPTQPPPPPSPPAIEHAARNYLILENFDETVVKDRNVQTQIIFGRKFVKCPKPKHNHELCAITGQQAKYRDPETGLQYANAYAYKEIKRLQRSQYYWSPLAGAYVGPGTYVASGVPERFRAALPGYKPPVAVIQPEPELVKVSVNPVNP